MGIEQKVAVITGPSQGIGAALVKAYRDRNYRVVATARSVRRLGDADVLAGISIARLIARCRIGRRQHSCTEGSSMTCGS